MGLLIAACTSGALLPDASQSGGYGAASAGQTKSAHPETSGLNPSPPPCQPAPDWLVTAIGEGVVVPGAYLSHVYVGTAHAFASGPPMVFADAFDDAWWVAGRLNGVGVQPELAIWLTNRTAEGAGGEILAVNPAARRYTDWAAPTSEPIAGDGLEPVQECVGPMPQT